MSEKEVRLNLEDLKVQSFVTTIDPKEQAAMFGQTGPARCGTGRNDCGTGGSCYDTQWAGCGDTSSNCTNLYCQTGGGYPACDYTYDIGCGVTGSC